MDYLHPALNEMTVIRITFETLDLFPAADPLRAEIFTEIVPEHREKLIASLRTLCDMIHAHQDGLALSLPFSYEAFKSHAIHAMKNNYSMHRINLNMKMTSSVEGENSLYYFESAGLLNLESIQMMPAHHFTHLMFHAVLLNAQNDASYTDQKTFDRQVYQNYILIMFFWIKSLQNMRDAMWL